MIRSSVLVLVAMLASPAFGASAKTPLEVVNEFWRAYASGDVSAALATWDERHIGRYRDLFEREQQIHCLQATNASLRLSYETPATAGVEIDATLLRTPVDDARAIRVEDAHYLAKLQRVDGEWRVVSWHRREDLFAEELVRTPAQDRDAKLAAEPALWNRQLVVALSRSAVLLSNRQRLDESAAILEIAREIAVDLDDDAALSTVLGAKSVYLRKHPIPDVLAAVEIGEEAERVALRSGDVDAIAHARMRLARAIEFVDVERARLLLLDVMESADRVDDISTIAFAASQLAWTYGDLEPATGFRYAVLASHSAELSGDPSPRMNAALNLGGAYIGAGELELAKIYYEKAVAVARETNAIVAEAVSLSHLAVMEWPETPDAKMPALYEQALELARCGGIHADVITVPLLTLRAHRALLRNDLADARAAVDAAMAMMYRSLLDERLAADLLAAEALLLVAESKPEEALLVIHEARALFAWRPLWKWEYRLCRPTARAFCALGRRSDAIAALRDGVSVVEDEREKLMLNAQLRQSYFSYRTGAYHDLIELLIEDGQVVEALQVSEQVTSRTLGDALGTDESRPRHSTDIERAEHDVVRLNRSILTARPFDPSLRRLREELTQARLRLNHLLVREAAAARHEEQVLQTPLELERVPQDAAVLRYVVAEDKTFVFIVRGSDGSPVVSAHEILISKGDLASRIDAFLSTVEARDLNYATAARALHRLLIQPVLADLDGVKRLSVVPDPPLWQLPFQTLLDAKGQHLLERFEVSYAPSVAWTVRTEDDERRPESILAVGDPSIGGVGSAMVRALVPGSTLGRLPDAAREAREVGRLYARSRILTGPAARESVLKDEIAQYDIVHLATHALIDEAQPRYSSIVLAIPQGTQEDGLLEARELESLDLNAQLVVLSACNTARGRGYSGEGVVGLAWALLSKGVRHTVVSQWKADSKATTALMVSFHRHLTSGDSPAAALRKAQLEVRRDVRYEDPLYWAPFVVVGTP